MSEEFIDFRSKTQKEADLIRSMWVDKQARKHISNRWARSMWSVKVD